MPDDTSPHGGEAFHPLPDRARIPKGGGRDLPAADGADARPELPRHPERMPADELPDTRERGSAGDGKPSVTQQPG